MRRLSSYEARCDDCMMIVLDNYSMLSKEVNCDHILTSSLYVRDAERHYIL
jgi:hypothetical protein